jgi:hypothetical protein
MLKIVAHKEGIFNRNITLYGFDKSEAWIDVVQQPAMRRRQHDDPELYGAEQRPFLTIDATAAQELMDTLWDCGLRPSEGSGSAGAMAATQKHLEDMRRLVFEKP